MNLQKILILFIFRLISVQLVKFRVRLNENEPKKCQCVLPELCLDDDVIFDGHGLLDPRVGDRDCLNLQEICCEHPQTNSVDDEIDEYIDDTDKQLIKSPVITCGTTVINPLKSRMTTNSRNTEFGELPWNLLILENMELKQKTLYRCGGSLIHPKVALTAAHCVSDFYSIPEKIIVRAGEWDTNSLDENLPHQDHSVDEIVIHPNYNPKSLRNDIALLFLDNPFLLARNIGIICLPINSNHKINESNCLASGWGRENFRIGKLSIILKKIGLNLVVRDKCLQLLRKTRLGRIFNLHRSFICAGGEKNKDTCKGDGGGPLICSLNNNDDDDDGSRFVQIGIVAWGIGCGQEHVPGVYVNVALFTDWIDDEISGHDLDTSFYKI